MSLEKTCKNCAWNRDGICGRHSPMEQSQSMDECWIDPLELSNLIEKWIPQWSSSSKRPSVRSELEDRQTCRGCKHKKDILCTIHNEPVADEFSPMGDCWEPTI